MNIRDQAKQEGGSLSNYKKIDGHKNPRVRH